MADDRYWHFLGLKAGASAAEITAEYRRLAKMFHPDRRGTKEDMQRLNEAFEIVTGKREAPSSGIFDKGSSSSSSSLKDLERILNLELTIRGLQNQLDNEFKAHKRTSDMWFTLASRDSDRLRKFEDLFRSLVLVMVDAKWLDSKSLLKEIADADFEADFESMSYDKIIEMERRLIDGPVKEAVSKSNSKGMKADLNRLQAELDRMKADRRRERQRPVTMAREINCANCDRPFTPKRSDAKTCSNTCRQALFRKSGNRCNGSGDGTGASTVPSA